MDRDESLRERLRHWVKKKLEEKEKQRYQTEDFEGLEKLGPRQWDSTLDWIDEL